MFVEVINTKNCSSVQMNMDSVTNAVTNTMTTPLWGKSLHIII